MAGQELFIMRRKFVKKAYPALIKDLLDGLFLDGVLNKGQKDSILEENRSTADQARSLIDMVMGKGDEASMKMIAHLQSEDPTFYSDLILSSDQPAQPEPQKKQQWSDTRTSGASNKELSDRLQKLKSK